MKIYLKWGTSFMLAALGLLSVSVRAQNKSGLHILKKFPVNSNGGWDYVTVDDMEKRIYVAHGTQVNVLNLSTGDSIGVITGTNGVHGIALVKALGKGYTSNGKSNTCSVFNLKTNQVTNSIVVGNNPDAIFYDDYSKKIYVFNGRSNDASVIDPATDQVVSTIALGGKPETGASDGKGHVFVNIETTNEVVVLNATSYQVERRFRIEHGEEPSGLAIDRSANRLFIGCGGNQTLVIMDANTGRSIANFAIGDCDGVAFDPALKMIYTSNGNGNLSVIRQLSADKYSFVENLETERGARTIGIDLKTHHLFLPTAQTKPVAATASNPNPRPSIVPNTFHILEVGK